jgi:isopenicillin N synthase-like dioxygenase
MSVIILNYEDLVNEKDLTKLVGEAFDINGLGILCVRDIPGLQEARMNLLPLAYEFSNLNDEIKSKYVHEESFYSFGWSHGKEKLQGGKPDKSKGSYYANPQYDRPVDDEEIIKKHAPFVHPNIWPKDDLPLLEHSFKSLGQLIVKVGILLGKQCDGFVNSKAPTYLENKLHNIIDTSLCCKARLLHYFPYIKPDVELECTNDENDFSSWCGWHNDHGSLTGLVSAIFLDKDGKEVPNPDPNAGLYIMSRKSECIKVSIPSDCVAFQIGETAQIHSGGILQATPHAVRGAKVEGISRETFAVFMEPGWLEPMNCPDGMSESEAQSQSSAENLPPGVPSLASRWMTTQNFGEFTDATLNSYY